MNLRVRIGRVVLDGVDPRDRRRFQAALQQELSRLLAQHGLPEGLGPSRDALAGPAVPVPAVPDARRLGTGIARSVYQAMDGSGRRK
jgi:hypothetical protein